MNAVTIVGCDLHDRKMLLKVAVDRQEPIERSFDNDREGRLVMIEFLIQFARQRDCRRIVFAYEASGQGFGLYDLLQDHGIECHVLSPTHLPKTPKGSRLKTDSRDAQKLFELARGYVLAGNHLPIVWTPPQALRADRELVRSRLETAEATSAVKLQIFSLLKRFGRPLPEWFTAQRYWSRRFVRWLLEEAQQLKPVVTPVLLGLVERFETLHRQVQTLERHLQKLAGTPRYQGPCKALRQLPGVGLLTALTFLMEMGDLTRFSNRRQVAAYLGLCPASSESGDIQDRKGHITRQGSGRLRKVLCQATWTAVRVDQEVRKKWERLKGPRGRSGKKAIVAAMRQLAIRMWHAALAAGVSMDLVARPMTPPQWCDPPQPLARSRKATPRRGQVRTA